MACNKHLDTCKERLHLYGDGQFHNTGPLIINQTRVLTGLAAETHAEASLTLLAPLPTWPVGQQLTPSFSPVYGSGKQSKGRPRQTQQTVSDLLRGADACRSGLKLRSL